AFSADSLRLKCDTLPYRSAYSEDGCYFAVLKKYCKSQGLKMPVPSNDLDNRIFRGDLSLEALEVTFNTSDVLIKDPVWLNKA
ncbi:hypothetical protein PMAYCL1PPCAC_27703, partial [Pristionchus mayeri]